MSTKPSTDPCQKYACKIQTCLQAMNYQEDKCELVIDSLVECCEKYGARYNCCSGFLKGQRKRNKPIKDSSEGCR
ncbi:hypothetical protein DPMN_123678 [Dreissena polymorpha]|uniref:Cx9C motif-containing protein 4 n=1 Tax=Dreissena polymorpha TaxID=45954 RepID=A0A9D4GUQ3_DREPO|nr:hypothetical protein DPMN_123678 [Dreissena polymorpha]